MFIFRAWVTGISFRPARSPFAHSLAWLVYHYWSLSLTWTNRGPFSKVVSQVAVTGVSGTVGLRVWLRNTESQEKPVGMLARLHHTWNTDSDNKNSFFWGCLGVLFQIKAGFNEARQNVHPVPSLLYSLPSLYLPQRLIQRPISESPKIFYSSWAFHQYSRLPNTLKWFLSFNLHLKADQTNSHWGQADIQGTVSQYHHFILIYFLYRLTFGLWTSRDNIGAFKLRSLRQAKNKVFVKFSLCQLLHNRHCIFMVPYKTI